MKLQISYDDLVPSLDYVSSVVEDKFLEDNMRNIIFLFRKDVQGTVSLMLAGYNKIATCRTALTDVDFQFTEEADDKWMQLEDGTFIAYMQIKSKELNNFLGSFRSLKKTKPTQCEFATVRNKVRLIVQEEPKDEEDERAAQLRNTSIWVFDNAILKPAVLHDILMQLPTEGEESIASTDVLFYLNTLFPLVSDEGGSSLPSKMHFSEEYIFCVPNFATLMVNQLPNAFKGIVLAYSALNFLKKVAEHTEYMTVNKTGTHITIKTDNSEAFLRYMTKMPDHTIYTREYKKDHMVAIDRVYLREVLKRLALTNDNVTIAIKPNVNVITVSNTKYSTDIPIYSQRGLEELGEEITFKMVQSHLNKAIIGDDTLFPDVLGIYLNRKGSGYTLVFSDTTGQWFSTMQVR